MNTIMRKLFLSLFVVIAGFVPSICGAHAETGSTGKEFFLSFQPNYGSNGTLSLFVTGERGTQGTVSVEGLNFNAPFEVQANKVTTIAIPAAAQRLPVNRASRLAVHVVADDEVTVYGLNQQQHTTDAFLALPLDALGIEYYALSYTATLPSQVAIVGVFDHTQVTITPASALTGHAAGVPFSIVLNRGETYLLTSSADVSGTSISADRPVAVMSGVECVYVPKGYSACDHIVEMMPPVSTWGKSFLTVPLATRRKGDVFRILAAEDDTKVHIDGVLVATLGRGKFFETILKARSEVETSAPVLVAQYSPGSSFDGVTSDPFMMLIPPTEQFLTQYTFGTPASGFSANFVNVVVPSGEVTSLQLDGAPVDSTRFSAIGLSGFSGAQLPVGLGSHHIASTSNVPFGIYVYGYASYDSYGYPGGMSFKAINPVGDPYPPNLRLVQLAGTIQGVATDSEDIDANGSLDAGEDLNGNGKIDRRSEDVNGDGKLDAGEDGNGNNILDRDTGLFKVELLPASDNLKLEALPFVPGALSAQFSITRVDPTKPGTGVLHIEDGAGNKVDAPVSIGAVAALQNVRVVETLSTGGIELDLTSFAKPPYSIKDEADQKTIEWRFDSFGADFVADLGFEIVLKDPTAGETRLISHKLDLYYDDVNGNPVHTQLGSRSVDVYPSIFQITPMTDRASYLAGEVVRITSTIRNLSAHDGTAALKLSIVDSGNVPVAALGTIPAQTIAAGASSVFGGLDFATGNTYVGNYQVLAELIDGTGKVLAFGVAPFAVAVSDGTSVSAQITTDKQLYGPYDAVHISEWIKNPLPNAALDDLRISTTVINPDGSVRFAQADVLQQLPPSARKDYAHTLTLAAAAAGRYEAMLTVSRADGTQLAQANAQFAVASTADTGAGLAGRISANPVVANMGQTVNLTFAVTNSGNSAVDALPLTVAIVDPAKQRVAATYPYSITLPTGGTYESSAQWLTAGDTGATYVAVLTAALGGKTLALAQTTFTVLKLDIEQTLAGGSRVLVSVSCNDEEAAISAADGTSSDCTTTRVAAIEEVLGALGVTHTVTTDEIAFKHAFRSGLYNTYWISGKAADKLHGDLAAELREAVFRGDGYLIDGGHDERNKTLDEVAGIRYLGKLGQLAPAVTLTGEPFSTDVLPGAGRALRVALTGGHTAATVPDQTGALLPAIVRNDYGRGRALFFGFDLVASIATETAWSEILGAALEHVVPASGTGEAVAGSVVPLTTTVANAGPATDVDVRVTLPPGFAYVDSTPDATLEGDEVRWAFRPDEDAYKALELLFVAPAEAGVYEVSTAVGTLKHGVTTPYGAPLVETVEVRAAVEILAEARLGLSGLALKTRADQRARETAIGKLEAVQHALAAGEYETAIRGLIAAIDALRAIQGADVTKLREGLAAALQEIEWRWAEQQP